MFRLANAIFHHGGKATTPIKLIIEMPDVRWTNSSYICFLQFPNVWHIQNKIRTTLTSLHINLHEPLEGRTVRLATLTWNHPGKKYKCFWQLKTKMRTLLLWPEWGQCLALSFDFSFILGQWSNPFDLLVPSHDRLMCGSSAERHTILFDIKSLVHWPFVTSIDLWWCKGAGTFRCIRMQLCYLHIRSAGRPPGSMFARASRAGATMISIVTTHQLHTVRTQVVIQKITVGIFRCCFILKHLFWQTLTDPTNGHWPASAFESEQFQKVLFPTATAQPHHVITNDGL